MSVAAAIRITSSDEDRVIARASAYAQARGEPCYVISIVKSLSLDASTDEERETTRRNLDLIHARSAAPVIQEGSDVAQRLIAVARAFGVRTLFVGSGHRRLFSRSIAEQVLHLRPPFEIIVLGREDQIDPR